MSRKLMIVAFLAVALVCIQAHHDVELEGNMPDPSPHHQAIYENVHARVARSPADTKACDKLCVKGCVMRNGKAECL